MDGMAEAFWLGLQRSDRFIQVFSSKLEGGDWLSTPPGFPNCALWIVGHMAYYRGAFLSLATGRPGPDEDWARRFGKGCPPALPQDLPDLGRCQAELEKGLRNWQDTLGKATEDWLRAPLPQPSPFFETRAELLAHLTHHEAHHTGCLSMLSRSLGKERVI